MAGELRYFGATANFEGGGAVPNAGWYEFDGTSGNPLNPARSGTDDAAVDTITLTETLAAVAGAHTITIDSSFTSDDDRWVVAQSFATTGTSTAQITLSDAQGTNSFVLAAGVTITGYTSTATNFTLTFGNGATLTISDATNFTTYDLGNTGTELTFAQFNERLTYNIGELTGGEAYSVPATDPSPAVFTDTTNPQIITLAENTDASLEDLPIGTFAATDADTDDITYRLANVSDALVGTLSINSATGEVSYTGNGRNLNFESSAPLEFDVIARSLGSNGVPQDVTKQVEIQLDDVAETPVVADTTNSNDDIDLQIEVDNNGATSTRVAAGLGDDTITGSSVQDRIEGGLGADTINLDSDTTDADTQGSDEVVYSITRLEDGTYVARGGGDSITGFTPGEDILTFAFAKSGDADEGATLSRTLQNAINDGGFEVAPIIDYAANTITGLNFVFPETINIAQSGLSSNIFTLEFSSSIAWADFLELVTFGQDVGFSYNSLTITSSAALQAVLEGSKLGFGQQANSLDAEAGLTAVAHVLDGPIEGARVYADVNGNGILDTQTDIFIGTTDSTGAVALFSDFIGQALIVDIEGARDVYSGTHFGDSPTYRGIAQADMETVVISPLTTAIVELTANDAMTEEEAITAIFGDSSGVTIEAILNPDNYVPAQTGETGATAQMQNTIAMRSIQIQLVYEQDGNANSIAADGFDPDADLNTGNKQVAAERQAAAQARADGTPFASPATPILATEFGTEHDVDIPTTQWGFRDPVSNTDGVAGTLASVSVQFFTPQGVEITSGISLVLADGSAPATANTLTAAELDGAQIRIAATQTTNFVVRYTITDNDGDVSAAAEFSVGDSGAPIVLGGAPTIVSYEAGSTTPDPIALSSIFSDTADSDGEAVELTYEVVARNSSGETVDFLAVAAAGGMLTFGAPNLGTDGDYTITITATDGDSNSASHTFTYDVSSAAPTLTAAGAFNPAILSGVQHATEATDTGLSFTLEDTDDLVANYNLIPVVMRDGVNVSSQFTLEDVAGATDNSRSYNLQINGGEDLQAGTYTIEIRGGDGEQSIATYSTTVTIFEPDVAPVFGAQPTEIAGITEGTDHSTDVLTIATVSATDGNGDTVTYHINEQARVLGFNVDEDSGVITYNGIGNFPTSNTAVSASGDSVSVVITARSSGRDGDIKMDRQEITVEVADNITFGVVQVPNQITENTLYEDFTILELTNTMPSAGFGAPAYSLNQEAVDLGFSISNMGIITYTGTADFETTGATINIIVTATSKMNEGTPQEETQFATLPLAIEVGNVLEFDTEPTPASITEDTDYSGAGDALDIATVSASSGFTVTYDLDQPAKDLGFAIDSATGAITYAGSGIDFETTQEVVLTITASDGGSVSPTQTLTVMIADLQDAPTLTQNGSAASVNAGQQGVYRATEGDVGDSVSTENLIFTRNAGVQEDITIALLHSGSLPNNADALIVTGDDAAGHDFAIRFTSVGASFGDIQAAIQNNALANALVSVSFAEGFGAGTEINATGFTNSATVSDGSGGSTATTFITLAPVAGSDVATGYSFTLADADNPIADYNAPVVTATLDGNAVAGFALERTDDMSDDNSATYALRIAAGTDLAAGDYAINISATSTDSTQSARVQEFTFTVEQAVNVDVLGSVVIAPTDTADTKPQAGDELTADISGVIDLNGFDPEMVSYQWSDANGEIDGATDSAYTPTEAGVYSVAVSFTDNAEYAESITSADLAVAQIEQDPIVVADVSGAKMLEEGEQGTPSSTFTHRGLTFNLNNNFSSIDLQLRVLNSRSGFNHGDEHVVDLGGNSGFSISIYVGNNKVPTLGEIWNAIKNTTPGTKYVSIAEISSQIVDNPFDLTGLTSSFATGTVTITQTIASNADTGIDFTITDADDEDSGYDTHTLSVIRSTDGAEVQDLFTLTREAGSNVWSLFVKGGSTLEEASYSISLTSSDGEQEAVLDNPTILLVGAAEAPATPPQFAVSTTLELNVDEGVAIAANEVVATLDPATDINDEDITYTLEGTHAAEFAARVNGDGDVEIVHIAGTTYDHETDATREITLVATTLVNNDRDTRDITITIDNVNEAPDVVAPIDDVALTIGVEELPAAINLNDTFSDQDLGDSLEFTFADDVAATAAGLTIENGMLVFGTPTSGAHTIEIVATDNDGASINAGFNYNANARTTLTDNGEAQEDLSSEFTPDTTSGEVILGIRLIIAHGATVPQDVVIDGSVNPITSSNSGAHLGNNIYIAASGNLYVRSDFVDNGGGVTRQQLVDAINGITTGSYWSNITAELVDSSAGGSQLRGGSTYTQTATLSADDVRDEPRDTGYEFTLADADDAALANNYAITITATNSAGEAVSYFSHQVIDAATGQYRLVLDGTAATPADTYSISIVANDGTADSAPLTYSVSVIDANAPVLAATDVTQEEVINQGDIGTPAVDGGAPYVELGGIRFEANEGAPANLKFNLFFTAGGIDAEPSASAVEGVSFEFAIGGFSRSTIMDIIDLINDDEHSNAFVTASLAEGATASDSYAAAVGSEGHTGGTITYTLDQGGAVEAMPADTGLEFTLTDANDDVADYDVVVTTAYLGGDTSTNYADQFILSRTGDTSDMRTAIHQLQVISGSTLEAGDYTVSITATHSTDGTQVAMGSQTVTISPPLDAIPVIALTSIGQNYIADGEALGEAGVTEATRATITSEELGLRFDALELGDGDGTSSSSPSANNVRVTINVLGGITGLTLSGTGTEISTVTLGADADGGTIDIYVHDNLAAGFTFGALNSLIMRAFANLGSNADTYHSPSIFTIGGEYYSAIRVVNVKEGRTSSDPIGIAAGGTYSTLALTGGSAGGESFSNNEPTGITFNLVDLDDGLENYEIEVTATDPDGMDVTNAETIFLLTPTSPQADGDNVRSYAIEIAQGETLAEGTYTISITASISAENGGEAQTRTQTFDIEVGGDAPITFPNTDRDMLSVGEGAAAGDEVGTITGAEDADDAATIAYTITSGDDDGVFAINSSGVISILDATNLDFETTQSYLLVITATSTETVVGEVVTSTATRNVEITIENADDNMATGAITIATPMGEALETGVELTATATTAIADADGVASISYQWFVGTTAIGTASATIEPLTETSAPGTYILRATVTDDTGATQDIDSNEIMLVGNEPGAIANTSGDLAQLEAGEQGTAGGGEAAPSFIEIYGLRFTANDPAMDLSNMAIEFRYLTTDSSGFGQGDPYNFQAPLIRVSQTSDADVLVRIEYNEGVARSTELQNVIDAINGITDTAHEDYADYDRSTAGGRARVAFDTSTLGITVSLAEGSNLTDKLDPDTSATPSNGEVVSKTSFSAPVAGGEAMNEPTGLTFTVTDSDDDVAGYTLDFSVSLNGTEDNALKSLFTLTQTALETNSKTYSVEVIAGQVIAAGSYVISISATHTDTDKNIAAIPLPALVVDIAEAPVAFTTSAYAASIGEDAAAGDALTLDNPLDASDPNTADDVTYELSGTGSELFVVGATGVITLAAGAALDYEMASSYSLTITATSDEDSGSDTATLTINIGNVNDEDSTGSLAIAADGMAAGAIITATPANIADIDGLANGTGDLTYVWYRDDVAITGQTSAMLTTTAGGVYRADVVVTDATGATTTISTTANVTLENVMDTAATGAVVIDPTANDIDKNGMISQDELVTLDFRNITDAQGLTNADAITYSVTGPDGNNYDSGSVAATATPSFQTLPLGTYTVAITVTDDLGNDTTLTPATFEVVAKAPVAPSWLATDTDGEDIPADMQGSVTTSAGAAASFTRTIEVFGGSKTLTITADNAGEAGNVNLTFVSGAVNGIVFNPSTNTVTFSDSNFDRDFAIGFLNNALTGYTATGVSSLTFFELNELTDAGGIALTGGMDAGDVFENFETGLSFTLSDFDTRIQNYDIEATSAGIEDGTFILMPTDDELSDFNQEYTLEIKGGTTLAAGTYDVVLTATNRNDGTQEATHTVTITVGEPAPVGATPTLVATDITPEDLTAGELGGEGSGGTVTIAGITFTLKGTEQVNVDIAFVESGSTSITVTDVSPVGGITTISLSLIGDAANPIPLSRIISYFENHTDASPLVTVTGSGNVDLSALTDGSTTPAIIPAVVAGGNEPTGLTFTLADTDTAIAEYINDMESFNITATLDGGDSTNFGDQFRLVPTGDTTNANSQEYALEIIAGSTLAAGTYSIEITASDGETPAQTTPVVEASVTIDAAVAPDQDVAFGITEYALTISEDAAAGVFAITPALDAADPDMGDDVTYSLTGAGNEFFSMAADGTLTYNGSGLDFETATTHTLTITATSSNDASMEATATLTINVDNAQEGGTDAVVSIDNGGDTAVGATLTADIMVTTIDEDGIMAGYPTYQWRLDDVDIDGATSATLDTSGMAAGNYSVQVVYRDVLGEPSDFNSAPATLTNTAPTVAREIADDTYTIGATAPAAIDLRTHFSDANGHSLTFTISGEAGSGITIENDNMLTFTGAPTAGTYTITITAADGFGESITDTFDYVVSVPADMMEASLETISNTQAEIVAGEQGGAERFEVAGLTFTAKEGTPSGLEFRFVAHASTVTLPDGTVYTTTSAGAYLAAETFGGVSSFAVYVVGEVSLADIVTAIEEDTTANNLVSVTSVAGDYSGGNLSSTYTLESQDIDTGYTFTFADTNDAGNEYAFTIAATLDGADVSNANDLFAIVPISGDALTTSNSQTVKLVVKSGATLAAGTYSITATASNTTEGETDEVVSFAPIALTVAPPPDTAPSITTVETMFDLAENAGASTEITTITATDAESHTISYSLAGADMGSFHIDSTSGVITYTGAALDFETATQKTFAVDVIATANGQPSAAHSITITLMDENEAPVRTATAAPVVEVTVGDTATTIDLAALFADPDAADNEDTNGFGSLEYTITAGGGDATISGDTLTFTAATLANSGTITVQADDGNGGTQTVDIGYTVTAAPDTAPSITSTGTAFDLAENAGAGTEITTITAVDAESHAISYSLAGADMGSFAISTSGVITYTGTALDFETATQKTFALDVIATANGLPSAAHSITINLTNQQEGAGQTTISINNGGNTAVGASLAANIAIDAPDPDGLAGSPTYQWSLNGTAIATARGATLDTTGMRSGTYSVAVTYRDVLGAETTFTDSVALTNTAPTLANPIDDDTYTTGTNAPDAIDLRTVFEDANGQALTFSISGETGSGITIENDNMLTFTGTPTEGNYTIRILARDIEGGNEIHTFDYSVIAFNAPPEWTDTDTSADTLNGGSQGSVITIQENAAQVFHSIGGGTLIITAEDAGAAGNVTLNFVGADPIAEIAPENFRPFTFDAATNTVTYDNGPSSEILDFDTNMMVGVFPPLAVTSLDEALDGFFNVQGSGISSLRIEQLDALAAAGGITVSGGVDASTTATNGSTGLSFTLTDDDNAISEYNAPTATAPGVADGTFILIPTDTDLSGNSQEFRLEIKAGSTLAEGQYLVTLTAQERSGTQRIEHDVVITIGAAVPDEDVAFATTAYTANVAEDAAAGALTLSAALDASDPNVGESVAYSIKSGNDAGLFSITEDGVVSYIGAGLNYESGTTEYTLVITATSSNGESAPADATLTITVDNADEPTSGSVTITPTDSTPQTAETLTATHDVTDIDGIDGALTIEWLDASGMVVETGATYTPADAGVYRARVSGTDNFGTAINVESAPITVAANGAPMATATSTAALVPGAQGAIVDKPAGTEQFGIRIYALNPMEDLSALNFKGFTWASTLSGNNGISTTVNVRVGNGPDTGNFRIRYLNRGTDEQLATLDDIVDAFNATAIANNFTRNVIINNLRAELTGEYSGDTIINTLTGQTTHNGITDGTSFTPFVADGALGDGPIGIEFTLADADTDLSLYTERSITVMRGETDLSDRFSLTDDGDISGNTETFGVDIVGNTVLEAGVYTITFTAEDDTGQSAEETYELFINAAPQLLINGDDIGGLRTTADSTQDTGLEFVVIDDDNGVTANGVTTTNTARFTITAGGEDYTDQFDFMITGTAPNGNLHTVFIAAGATRLPLGTTTFTVVASDGDVAVGGGAVSRDSAELTFTLTLAEPDYPVEFADASALTTSITENVVGTDNILFTFAEPTDANTGTTIDYEITGTGAANLAFTINNGMVEIRHATGASFDFENDGAAVNLQFVATSTDGSQASRAIEITVMDENEALETTPIPTQNHVNGETLASLDLATYFSDPEGAAISYTLGGDNVAAGVSVSGSSLVFGTSTGEATYNIDVIATAVGGDTETITFTYNQGSNFGPVINTDTSGGVVAGVQGDSFVISGIEFTAGSQAIAGIGFVVNALDTGVNRRGNPGGNNIRIEIGTDPLANVPITIGQVLAEISQDRHLKDRMTAELAEGYSEDDLFDLTGITTDRADTAILPGTINEDVATGHRFSIGNSVATEHAFTVMEGGAVSANFKVIDSGDGDYSLVAIGGRTISAATTLTISVESTGAENPEDIVVNVPVIANEVVTIAQSGSNALAAGEHGGEGTAASIVWRGIEFTRDQVGSEFNGLGFEIRGLGGNETLVFLNAANKDGSLVTVNIKNDGSAAITLNEIANKFNAYTQINIPITATILEGVDGNTAIERNSESTGVNIEASRKVIRLIGGTDGESTATGITYTLADADVRGLSGNGYDFEISGTGAENFVVSATDTAGTYSLDVKGGATVTASYSLTVTATSRSDARDTVEIDTMISFAASAPPAPAPRSYFDDPLDTMDDMSAPDPDII